MNTEQEVVKIAQYVRETAISDTIPALESDLNLSIGFGQRIGELLNEAEHNYFTKRASKLNELRAMEDETETIRKTKLDAWVADDKKLYQDLKNIQTHLKALRMMLFSAIKSRRQEPY